MNMRGLGGRWAKTATALLCLGGWSVAALPVGTYRLVLHDALAVASRTQGAVGRSWPVKRHDLHVDIHRTEAGWHAVAWAHAPLMVGVEHAGRVVESEEKGGQTELLVRLEIGSSRARPTMLGGRMDVRLVLGQAAEGLSGRYRLTAEGLSDAAALAALEASWGFGVIPGEADHSQPTLANQVEQRLADGPQEGPVSGSVGADPLFGFDPGSIAAGEHPRLLFRAADVAGLRERARTPEGAAILQRLDELLGLAHTGGFGFHGERAEHSMGNIWAVGEALKYQLTGDASHAASAKAWCHANLFGAYYNGGQWIHPYTLMGLALCYDLCYDAWDRPFRDMIYACLEQNVRYLAMDHGPEDLLRTAERFVFKNDMWNFSIGHDRHAGNFGFRMAGAMAALAILNDPPPLYEPVDPSQVPLLAAERAEPWHGVPVVEYESDIMPRAWLINGPFRRGEGLLALEAASGGAGPGGVRPEPGQTLVSDGVAVDWRSYLPNNWQDPNGPAIYARNCGRYWASATGGGYAPGIELTRRWKQTAGGRDVGVEVLLYTVIENRTSRVVQALPNWRSPSAGSRMWLAGRELRDGECVRLEPGLYPLLVQVPLVGAYSEQAPRLRTYDRASFAGDREQLARARAAFSGGDLLDNPHARNLVGMLRSIRRYVAADIDAEGWGAQATADRLLPLYTTVRHALGINLAEGTGLDELVPLAVRLRGHMDPRACDVFVSQSLSLMPERYRGVARWFGQTYGWGFRRPIDAVICFATLDPAVAAVHPEALLTRSGATSGYGVHTFRSGWSGSEDVLVAVDAGGVLAESAVAGQLAMSGLGRTWVERRSASDPGAMNILTLRGHLPTEGARVVHAEHRADGSGSLTLLQSGIGPAEPDQRGRRRAGAAAGSMQIQRSFAVDFSARSGSPAVVVVVDRLTGTAGIEKSWRYALGSLGTRVGQGPDQRGFGLQVDSGGFLARPAQGRHGHVAGATLRASFPGVDGLGWRHTSGNKEGTVHVLEAVVERFVSEKQAVVDQGPRSFDRDELDSEAFLRELDRDAQRAQREQKTTAYVVQVLTLQVGDAPAVEVSGEPPAMRIRVGGSIAVYDGVVVRFEAQP